MHMHICTLGFKSWCTRVASPVCDCSVKMQCVVLCCSVLQASRIACKCIETSSTPPHALSICNYPYPYALLYEYMYRHIRNTFEEMFTAVISIYL